MSSTNAPIADHLLADRVAAFHTELAKQAPAEVVRALVSEIDGVVRSGAGAKAPRVGDTAPSFTLPDAQGKQVSLDSLLKEGRVVIAFYRGQWCPYCDLQLRAYQEVLPRIKALGANLVAISPQTPDPRACRRQRSESSSFAYSRTPATRSPGATGSCGRCRLVSMRSRRASASTWRSRMATPRTSSRFRGPSSWELMARSPSAT